MTETIKLNPSKLNNARMGCMGWTAIYDYEPVDEKRGIWKGTVIIDLNTPKGLDRGTCMFFSRIYKKDNDQDRMLQEYEIVDESIRGVKFLLVPRDKLLFLYAPPSIIVMPPAKIQRKFGQGR